MWISLPYGEDAKFDAHDLLDHVAQSGRDYIIQGQVHCRFDDHPKPHSLDMWLRHGYTSKKDVCQAVNKVMAELVATGWFAIEYGLICPDSGCKCKGLRLTLAGKSLADSRGWKPKGS